MEARAAGAHAVEFNLEPSDGADLFLERIEGPARAQRRQARASRRDRREPPYAGARSLRKFRNIGRPGRRAPGSAREWRAPRRGRLRPLASTFTSSPGSVKGTKSGPSGPCATPSPWAPSRSILTSSCMAGADQHFLVAAAARNRGGHLGKDLPARSSVDERPDLGYGPLPRLRIADDAAFSHPLAANLELRLDQSHEPGARRGKA